MVLCKQPLSAKETFIIFNVFVFYKWKLKFCILHFAFWWIYFSPLMLTERGGWWEYIYEIKKESVTPLSKIVLTTLSNFLSDMTALHITVCVSLGSYESNLSNHYMCMCACFVRRNVKEQKQTAHRLAGSSRVSFSVLTEYGHRRQCVFGERNRRSMVELLKQWY